MQVNYEGKRLKIYKLTLFVIMFYI